jgi:hypothetical protein
MRQTPRVGRIRVTLLGTCIVLLALFAPAGRAQNPGEAVRTVATYTIQGSLRTASDDTALPVPVVRRLSREGALAALDVNVGSAAGSQLRAVFIFDSAAAFDAWMASPGGREVMDLLRKELSEPSAVFSLRSWPLAALLPEAT